MALRIRFQHPADAALGYSIERLADGLYHDFADGTFKATPTTLVAALTAGTGSFAGRYLATLMGTPTAQFSNGEYCVTIHDTAASNAVVAQMSAAMYNGDDAPVFPVAGGGADPWATPLPGGYGAGTAGAIVGARLDAAVTSRLAASSYVAPTSGPSLFEIVNGIWDAPRANHSAANTFGGALDSPVSSRLAASSYVTSPSATQVASAVWTDATPGDFSVPNSAGLRLASAATGGDPWTATLPGSYAAGTAGAILGANLDAKVSTRSTYAGGPVAGVTSPVTVGTNNDKAGYALSGSGLDAVVVESGVNARQALAPILAAAAGGLSGAGSGSIAIKGGNVATTRILATTDAAGNRTSVTLVLPA